MPYRFTIEYDDSMSRPALIKAQVEVHEDASIDELVQCFKQFCLAAGYQPANVQEIYYGIPDSIPEEEYNVADK